MNISNQNVLAAEAQFRAAKDAVRIARSALFPTISANPSITSTRISSTLSNNNQFSAGIRTDYLLPIDLSYQAVAWGRIAAPYGQARTPPKRQLGQLENARLSFQAELAQDYFLLHGVDAEEDLLERTVKSYEQYLELTRNRYKRRHRVGSGRRPGGNPVGNHAGAVDRPWVARAQFEHAIAILTGKPPSALSVPRKIRKSPPPPVPVGVPSSLLERRPDIAAAERQMASANEQIGIAQAAYYPALTLGLSAGLESSSFLQWFSWPSRLWSVGVQAAETIFDAGKRHAQTAQAKALYDATVANYRQTVLTGFQQVEDNLAALRILEKEEHTQDAAVLAAQQFLDISSAQYKAGTTSYLQVIIAQTAALQTERTAVDILTRRMAASVLLVEALGGGWDASRLPAAKDLIRGK